MRIPARILEHPIESVIASLLLLALLFVSGEPPSSAQANSVTGTQLADSQKM
jgi:hypothetical protein